LKNAIASGVDIEWYESGLKRITELGISTLPLDQTFTTDPLPKLNNMTVHHFRIKENAHLVNGRRCEGHLEDFQFGSTGFVTEQEARGVLNALLCQEGVGYLRPMILIGHAVENDIQVFRDHLHIDLAEYPILMTLDTQVMAKELGIEVPPGRKIGLRDLLDSYGVKNKLYLHNAGNDAALTTTVGCL
ncbi:hypothetical protein BU23DRAFT_397790, partial [Bimuria novae-zelandiae CBS 107.79]